MSSTRTSEDAERNWSFVREPFWLFSHVFVASLVALFLFFCFGWQVSRHYEKAEQNEIIEARSFGAPADLDAALDRPLDELDFTAVEVSGTWDTPELIRVANRSQNGQAGDWQLGTFRTDDGTLLVVNRGFIPRDATGGPGAGTKLTGWLRETRVKERFGAVDTGVGERVPRLDLDALEARFGQDFAPMWLQLESPTDPNTFPQPVPLPALNSGPHLSYAVQWFIFATLGAIVYGLVLRKRAGEPSQVSTSL